MLAAIFVVTVRCRRPILTIALVLAVVLFVGRWLSDLLDSILGNATILAVMLALSLALLALLRPPRPAALLVKPEVRAFATEPTAFQVYMAVQLMFSASLLLGTDHLGEVVGGPFMVLPFLLLVGVGVHVAGGLRGFSVELRPDGVCQRDFTGSLTVPWEALAPGRMSDRCTGGAPAVTPRAGTITRPRTVRFGRTCDGSGDDLDRPGGERAAQRAADERDRLRRTPGRGPTDGGQVEQPGRQGRPARRHAGSAGHRAGPSHPRCTGTLRGPVGDGHRRCNRGHHAAGGRRGYGYWR